jgi:hypothetical protein
MSYMSHLSDLSETSDRSDTSDSPSPLILAPLASKNPQTENSKNSAKSVKSVVSFHHNPLCLRALAVHQKKIYFSLDKERFVWYTYYSASRGAMPSMKDEVYPPMAGRKDEWREGRYLDYES